MPEPAAPVGSNRFLLWAGAVVLLVLGAYHGWQRWTVTDDLPQAIGVRWVKEITIDPGFPTWLITPSAGYVLYELDDRTIETLERCGLECLREALVPRDDADGTDWRRAYQPWQASPVPATWTRSTPEGRGFWSGLVFSRFSPEFERQFLAAAQAPGSFYTENGQGDTLLVMPKLRIAVLAWWH